MTGDEVGVKVRQKHVRDAQIVPGGEGQILVDIPLGIDDGGDTGVLVADEIGRMGEAIEVELLQEHGCIIFEVHGVRAVLRGSQGSLPNAVNLVNLVNLVLC